MLKYIGLVILLLVIILIYYLIIEDRETYISASKCQLVRDSRGNVIRGQFPDGSYSVANSWLPYYAKVTECVPIEYENVCRDDCSGENTAGFPDDYNQYLIDNI